MFNCLNFISRHNAEPITSLKYGIKADLKPRKIPTGFLLETKTLNMCKLSKLKILT